MNRFIRRVFDAYALLLLVAVVLPPWRGECWSGTAAPSGPIYAWLWSPPAQAGWSFAPDSPRLFLEVLSLSLILAVAVVDLWDPAERRSAYQGSSRPS